MDIEEPKAQAPAGRPRCRTPRRPASLPEGDGAHGIFMTAGIRDDSTSALVRARARRVIARTAAAWAVGAPAAPRGTGLLRSKASVAGHRMAVTERPSTIHAFAV